MTFLSRLTLRQALVYGFTAIGLSVFVSAILLLLWVCDMHQQEKIRAAYAALGQQSMVLHKQGLLAFRFFYKALDGQDGAEKESNAALEAGQEILHKLEEDSAAVRDDEAQKNISVLKAAWADILSSYKKLGGLRGEKKFDEARVEAASSLPLVYEHLDNILEGGHGGGFSARVQQKADRAASALYERTALFPFFIGILVLLNSFMVAGVALILLRRLAPLQNLGLATQGNDEISAIQNMLDTQRAQLKAADTNIALLSAQLARQEHDHNAQIAHDLQTLAAAFDNNALAESITTPAVDALRHHLKEKMETVHSLVQALVKGDFKRTTAPESQGFPATLETMLAALDEKMRSTISSIASTGTAMAATVHDATASSAELARRTGEQAQSLQRTATAMDAFSATVRQNSDNAQQANQLATATRSAAERGGSVAGEAVAAMGRIEEAAQKISDIIGVIDEIAFQTNLLALNAAVEAARAGDAGKGFAVVATEVRALAQRSSTASKQIKELILNSSSEVQSGVALVRRAGDSLGEIVGSVKRVADIVAEIAAASREQAGGIEQVNATISQMDAITRQGAQMVETNSRAAQSLSQHVGDLQRVLALFKGQESPHAAAMPAVAMIPKPSIQPVQQPEPIMPPCSVKPKASLTTVKKEAGATPAVVKPLPPQAKPAHDEDDWKEF